MKFIKPLIVFCLLMALGCGSDDGPALISFETLEIGKESPVEPGRSQHVLNDDPEYEQLFGTTAPVDFDTETIIAVFLGPVGNDGNTFEISEIVDNGSSITVKITWRVPRIPSGDNTYHYHVIKTRKLSRPITFSTLEVRE